MGHGDGSTAPVKPATLPVRHVEIDSIRYDCLIPTDYKSYAVMTASGIKPIWGPKYAAAGYLCETRKYSLLVNESTFLYCDYYFLAAKAVI
jgi:hypothetical protein